MAACKMIYKTQFLLTFLMFVSLIVTWYASMPQYETSDQTRPSRTHILIVTSWRSGSSFVGQLFNQNPNVFYLTEPEWHVWDSITEKSPSFLQIPVRELLKSIFSCNMSLIQRYLRRPRFVTDLFLWYQSRALCSPPACDSFKRSDIIERQTCYQKCGKISFEQMGDVCNTYSHIVLKSVRIMDLRVLYPLLKDRQLNLKIIHLVRDPRAVLLSRERFDGLVLDDQIMTGFRDDSPDVFQVMKEICKAQVRIYNSFLVDPPNFLKGRYVMVRYEDLVRDPLGHVRDWYNLAGLSMSAKLESWIYNITHGRMENDNSFFPLSGNSEEIAQQWRNSLDFRKVIKLQHICKQEMDLFGYKLIKTEKEQKNLSLHVI